MTFIAHNGGTFPSTPTSIPPSFRRVALTTFSVRDEKGAVVERHDARDPYLLLRSEHAGMAFGLDGMKPGGKRRLTVPAALHRWNRGFGNEHPSSGDVTIDVELLQVKLILPDADAPGC